MGKDFTGAPQWRDTAPAELKRMKPGDVLFVNSMSDTYHELVDVQYIRRISDYARDYPHLTFLLLTKRADRMAEIAPNIGFPSNVWHGVSIEHPMYLGRLRCLKSIPGKKFISFEPLLCGIAPVDLTGIDWAIVGAESGANRRFFDEQWARDLRKSCEESGTVFFYKQGSAFKPGQNRVLDGKTWDATPFGARS
jgi:protein gp37